MAEVIDVFDANYQHIGTMERGAAHRAGAWHQSFHCWIVSGAAPESATVLLQLRSATKDTYPNLYDVSAAGHLDAGESPVQGVREIEEEIGLRVDEDRLVYLGIRLEVGDDGGLRNREFAHTFLLRDDTPLDELTLDEHEVAGVAAVRLADLLALFSHRVDEVTVRFRNVEGGVDDAGLRQLRRSDLAPRVDNYYFRVAIMADLMLRGATHLSI